VPSRRRSTVKVPHATAREVHEFPKSVELEQRVSRLELRVAELADVLSATTKRTIAMEAQLDHLIAKLTGRF
jgi:hypothetical protein